MACAMETGGVGVYQQRSDTPCVESDAGDVPQGREWDLYDHEAIGEGDELKGDRAAFTTAVKLLKLAVYAVTFCVVLGGGVVSKATAIFMTSVVGKGRGFAPCNITGMETDKRFVIQLSPEERHTWTWCLLFVLVVPEILTFFRSARLCVFKQYKRPRISTVLVVFFAESLHTVGLVLVVFSAFPKLHVLTALSLTNTVCLVPSLFNVISGWSRDRSAKSWLKNLVNLAAMAGQMSVFAWAGFRSDSSAQTVVGIVLVSVAWWENFTGKTRLVHLKEDIETSKNFVYVFVSLWKAVLVFASCLVCVFFDGDDVAGFLRALPRSFEGTRHNLTMTWPKSEEIPNELRPKDQILKDIGGSHPYLPFFVAGAHIASSYLCYTCAKFACKVCIQGFSFALPIVLTVPATIGLLATACAQRGAFREVLPVVFWNCPQQEDRGFFDGEIGWLWLVWLMSQAWVTVYVWFPTCERMASTHKLFVNPMYCTVLIDQSLALNRRKDELVDRSEKKKKPSLAKGDKNKLPPMIFACATMWHETLDEMEQLLKSIMRMDYHQCQQKIFDKVLDIKNPDYYEMEAHIFFDDAFVFSDTDDDKMTINTFVKDLIVAVNIAARKVYKIFEELGPPIKVPTPYGGRLIWILHGSNTLNVHLKNKELIRHKKRWSQVMYMYYLLGYHLRNCFEGEDEGDELYRNTFILALDGDIDFQPDAVQLLVDLMTRNKGLGAACGRIHPVGTGLMVSYQKFEYAIGHWLQKATEHMIGCVLCSPGCFSLFRAEALVKNNTVRRYATTSREAIEYVQFDQGEDRWLCTLLLQRGYRVEYSAASDAYTHCPESFAEFYTQRRRWGPSTLANIADLLVHYEATVQLNDNISRPYIAYQILLMMGTILGPGTIFLMLVGAMVTAFGISNWHSFAANIVPIIFFIIICFQAKNDMQIFVAQVLSALYALLMMAVLVSISLQMAEDGLTSPSAIFVLAMAASFVLAALLHPQECWCVAHGLLYFLSVPSMYLLLALYSFVNLHVVSWGTREVAAKKSGRQVRQEVAAAAAAAAAAQKKKAPASKGGMLDWMSLLGSSGHQQREEEEGGISFNLANLFRCMCFTHPKPDPSALHMARVEAHLREISGQVTAMQRQMDCVTNRAAGYRRRSFPHSSPNDSTLNAVAEDKDNEEEEIIDQQDEESDDEDENDGEADLEHWMSEECLKDCRVMRIEEEEEMFWKDMIKTYLEPLKDDPEDKAKVSRQLLDLRNNVVFGILMLNALFVLVVFLLQMKKDDLHVEWPLNGKANITFLPEFDEIRIEMAYLQLEPINLVLVFFFTLILVVQFVGMIFHRFQTLSHILSSTELIEPKTKDEEGKKLISQMNDKLHRLRLKEDEPRPPPEDEDDAARPPEGSCAAPNQDGGSLLDERVAKGKPKLRSLSETLEQDLLSILEKNDKFAVKVRRMSKNPDVVAALKRRTSNYNLGTPGSSRAVRTPSMRSAVLGREFGTPRGSSRATPLGSVRHSNLSRDFVPNDSFDTESVNSIEMKDLRNPASENSHLKNSADRHSAGGSHTNLRNSAGGSSISLRNSADRHSASGSHTNLRNSAGGSHTNLRNSAGGSSISLRNSADGDGRSLKKSAGGSCVTLRNSAGGSGVNLRNSAGGSGVNLRNYASGNSNDVNNSTVENDAVSKNYTSVENEGSANGNDFREWNDSSVGNDVVNLMNSESERGVNLNKSGIMNLRDNSVRRGSVNLRSYEVKKNDSDGTFSPLLNASHLQRKLRYIRI